MNSLAKSVLVMAVALVGAVATAVPAAAYEDGAPPTTKLTEPPLYTQYTAKDGDTLDTIATASGMTKDEVRWSNPLAADIKAGDTLWLSSVHPGIVYTVAQGDMLSLVAAKYQVDLDKVITANKLGNPDLILPGQVFLLPDAKAPLPDPPPAQPVTQPVASMSMATARPATRPQYAVAGNHFAYGYCTFYVASRRPVPWSGDAGQWYGNARAMGFPVGPTPRPGAIMVTWESRIGHVAYVESVGGDGSWTVSEMNYKGWNVVSSRTIRPGQVPLIGFIY